MNPSARKALFAFSSIIWFSTCLLTLDSAHNVLGRIGRENMENGQKNWLNIWTIDWLKNTRVLSENRKRHLFDGVESLENLHYVVSIRQPIICAYELRKWMPMTLFGESNFFTSRYRTFETITLSCGRSCWRQCGIGSEEYSFEFIWILDQNNVLFQSSFEILSENSEYETIWWITEIKTPKRRSNGSTNRNNWDWNKSNSLWIN